MSPLARIRLLRRDERGFSLVELVVALGIGMVILFAVLGFVEVSMSASARVEDRVDVVQRGRAAMEQITQQLRSQVCLGPSYPPIGQATDTSVSFYTDLEGETFTPKRHELVYDADADAITERVYALVTLGPPAIFALTPERTRTIVSDVVPVAGDAPVFRYYAFTGTDPIRADLRLAAPPPLGLSAADLARTVKVAVSFKSRPTRGREHDRVETTFENSVIVRVADPFGATDAERGPQCL